MKKIKVKFMLAFITMIVLLFINVGFVKAEEASEGKNDWTDVKLDLEKEVDGENISYYVKLSGLKKDHNYFLVISNSKDDLYKADGVVDGAISKAFDDYMEFDDNGISRKNINEYLENSGDVYYQIVEQYVSGNYIHKIIKDGTIERPELPKLGTRIKCYFFSDKTSIYQNTTNSLRTRNVKLKIGTISDQNIINEVLTDDTKGLAKLLEYAKTANAIKEVTVPVDKSASITSELPLTDKGLYYVYAVLDDENGKYYPVEDVSLYQAIIGETIGKNLFDYLDDNFEYKIVKTEVKEGKPAEPTKPAEEPAKTEEEPKEEDYKGKKTGTESENLGTQAGANLTIVYVIAIVGAISFISYKKYNKTKIK